MYPKPQWLRLLVFLFIVGMVFTINSWNLEAAQKDKPGSKPITTKRTDIPLDELELLLKPLTKDELISEADAWQKALKIKVEEVSAAEIAVKRKNKEIEKAEEAREKIAKTQENLYQEKATAQDAAPDKDAPKEPAPEAASQKTTDTAQPKEIATETNRAANVEAEEKSKILDAVTTLRAERTALIDRLGAVLDELNDKLGTTADGKDNEVVAPYRLYMNAVSGIKVDVSDKEAAWASLRGWLQSSEGGVRWARNILLFIGIVFVFWVLGLIFGKLTEKAFAMAKRSSILLRKFAVVSVQRVTLIIGFIFGLAALEINIGPLLALIGAAGFVVAFALQGTLSNFASGIMIMLYKPFDVGNFVDVAGVSGTVRSMNLVTTTITTPDNQIMVVPNNSIWGNIITNITGSEERRVDLVFGIGYGDNIDHAQQVLVDVVGQHPLVLRTPAPVVQVHELAESSVNFICRPWAKTDDYWTVYWDITRTVKERFDAEGISIPFPQQDVHFFQESPKAPNAVATSESESSSPAAKRRDDERDDNDDA